MTARRVLARLVAVVALVAAVLFAALVAIAGPAARRSR